jgi:dipeptidase E
MKLLLTSGGFTNQSIANALLELAGKPFNEMKLAFIPTAANVEEGDKGWLINDLANCKKLGFAEIDIVDFSALPKEIWQKRLEAANILIFGGGNTFHLMHWLIKSGLREDLPRLLEKRVYVGISAGSMVAAKRISLSQSKRLYYPEEAGRPEENEGLGLVEFQLRPHLNSPDFPNVRIEYLKELAKNLSEAIYAIDDNSAVVVNEGKISVVSEGKWEKIN